MRIRIGKNAYKNSKNDYEDMWGTIFWCNKCCGSNRVQFDYIANSELLSNFNLLKCRFITNELLKEIIK